MLAMNLFKLRDSIQTLPALEKQMELLQKELLDAESTVSCLLRRYEQECRDVKQIQKNSLSSFMFKLIGKYDGKLDKEQREEIAAKLAYDRALTHLEHLEIEKNDLSYHILALQADKQRYQSELENRRQNLNNQQTEPSGVQYVELETMRKTLLTQITELKQALSTLAHAKATVKNTLKSLKSAQNWTTYDIFVRGGIITHMAKYSHIDEAEKNYHLLSSQLRHLNSELNDIADLTLFEFNEISSTQRSVDIWFDNIFTDLSVHNKVKGNTEQMTRLLNNLNTIESTLNSKLDQRKTELQENRCREETLLLSLHEPF